MKLRKFRFAEQRGFQTFFENWKTKVLARESSHIEQYDKDTVDEKRDDVSDDETSNDVEDSKFSHL